MNKIRNFLSKPAVTAVLFVLAVALIAGGTIGGALAALEQFSEVYESRVAMKHIDVEILENGTAVSGEGAMLQDFLTVTNGELVTGREYDEVLTVRNSADAEGIDQFVRVTVLKYWLDPNGEKTPDLDSDWIHLTFVTDGGWTIDTASSTEERTVLYYGSVLAPGQESTPFLSKVSVDNEIVYNVTQTTTTDSTGLTTITTTFNYDGYKLCLVASVDAIQTHNAVDAAKSAWGRDVSATATTISLN